MIRFLTNPTTWLVAGLSIMAAAAAPAALAVTPQDIARQAEEDAKAAAVDARDAARDVRREVRIIRKGDGDQDMIWLSRGQDRAERLSDILQLRPEQQPALKAFLAATQMRHVDHMVRFDGDPAERTTLQRLDDMQARLAEQQAETTRRIEAIRTFYGQLDAGQKKAFDALPMVMVMGPAVGPMMVPHPMPIVQRMPSPPEPPAPPKAPRS